MTELPITIKSLLPVKLRQWVYSGTWSWEREAIEVLHSIHPGIRELEPSPDEYLTIELVNIKTKRKAKVVFHRNTNNPGSVKLISWDYI